MKAIVKTRRGNEKIVASYISDLYPNVMVKPIPWGSRGIVLVEGLEGEEQAYSLIEKIPEIEKILPIICESKADLEDISKCVDVVIERISPEESFAVRTTRRGEHEFTSLDVNAALGAIIKEKTAARVNLDNPDKVVWVEIFGDKAFISITEEQVIGKKTDTKLLEILSKISFAQIPYLENKESAYRMGVRIGRAAQTFEIGELIITPVEPANLIELKSFIDGLLEGRRSRYEIQRKSYPRRPRLVPFKLQNLYQFARSRLGEVFITTSTRGEPLTDEKCREIINILENEKRVTIYAGAREGVPTGIIRWSKYTINLAPGVTFATEHTIPTTITAIITCYEVAKRR